MVGRSESGQSLRSAGSIAKSQKSACALPYSGDESLTRFKPGGLLQIYGVLVDKFTETSPILNQAILRDSAGQYGLLWCTGKELEFRALRLSSQLFRLFHQANKWNSNNSSPSHRPENTFKASPISEAILRTLVADWIDLTRKYESRSHLSVATSNPVSPASRSDGRYRKYGRTRPGSRESRTAK